MVERRGAAPHPGRRAVFSRHAALEGAQFSVRPTIGNRVDRDPDTHRTLLVAGSCWSGVFNRTLTSSWMALNRRDSHGVNHLTPAHPLMASGPHQHRTASAAASGGAGSLCATTRPSRCARPYTPTPSSLLILPPARHRPFRALRGSLHTPGPGVLLSWQDLSWREPSTLAHPHGRRATSSLDVQRYCIGEAGLATRCVSSLRTALAPSCRHHASFLAARHRPFRTPRWVPPYVWPRHFLHVPIKWPEPDPSSRHRQLVGVLDSLC